MNYFFSNLFSDKKIYVLLGLSAVVGLIIMDFLSFMLMGNGFFNLWVIKITAGSVVVGTIVYALFLHRRDTRTRQLEILLPVLNAARRAYFAEQVAADPGFQTLCHECRHFDLPRLRCLLRLQGRKMRIKLQQESVFSYCLYWNLDDRHPIMLLTERVNPGSESPRSPENGEAAPPDVRVD